MLPDRPPVPRTEQEWARVRRAKLQVLARDPMEVHPADFPQVRPEVLASWRRSMLAGVDPEATGYKVEREVRPHSRLAAAASPIMERLGDQIGELNAWAFLTDADCRLLLAVIGDFPQARRIRRQNIEPGTTFAEDVMGTNGLGCARETGRAFVISGAEHFRTDTELITTTGVLIRDPFTRRQVGTLGAHCLRGDGTAAMLPLVVELGRAIEAELAASRTDGERVLFDAFRAAERRYRGTVMAISRRLCVVSTRARALVREADEEPLRRLAAESGTRRRTVRRRLSSGVTVAIQVVPVEAPRGDYAAILVLSPVAGQASPTPAEPGEAEAASSAPGKGRPPAGGLDELRAAERGVLLRALRECGGDRNAMAARLGVSRATVYRKLKRHDLR